MRTPHVIAVFAALAALSVSAALTVEECSGEFSVLRDGKVLISKIACEVGDVQGRTKSSCAIIPDGGKVWNRWCEDRDHRFRLEVAQRADGAIEVSLLGEVEAPVKGRMRYLTFELPEEALQGKVCDGLMGNGRDYSPVSGTFDEAFSGRGVRWLAVDGVTFDFNPMGSADYNSGFSSKAINGVWNLSQKEGGGGYSFRGGGEIKMEFGGYVGTKVVLREGTNDDFGRIHFIRKFRYRNHIDSRIVNVRRVCFGAPKFGKNYLDGNRAFKSERGYGWLSGAVRTVAVGHGEGAYYSNVHGRGKAKFRFAGLSDGWYIVTLQCGNWTGVTNRFCIAVNGIPLGGELAVPEKNARTVSHAVRVTGGNADFVFEGDWLVSALSLQPLMSDDEDYSMRRGFWFSEGYEPATFYRSVDFPPVAELPVADEMIDMPPPGRECEGQCGKIEMPIDRPDLRKPSLSWVGDAKMLRFLTNYATFAEFDDPKVLRDFIDRELEGRDCSSVIISGMHSRHTYENHVQRGIEAIGRLTDEFHRRGIKVVDHHDVTLLWNFPSGFRVMMERLGETVRGTSDYAPAPSFCPNNREFKRNYTQYVRALLAKGVDGLKLDEVEFWSHGCQCKACREDFHRDTGWWMPLNECHPALSRHTDPLAKALYEWRTKKATNWFIDLRRAVKDLNPDLVFFTYTTHWGLIRSLPREYATYNLLDFPRAMSSFGTEVMTRNILQSSRPLVPYRKMYNLISLQYDVPMWGWFYCSDWQSSYFAAALSAMCGQVGMTSASISVQDDSAAPPFERWMDSPLAMQRKGAETIAEVAILFSVASRDWNTMCDFGGELFGTAQELEAMHVPYDILAEVSLDDSHLKKYKVLVLGASNCISDKDVMTIRRFAENGGTVILSSLTGLFDELGFRRKRAAFGDVTGYDPTKPEVRRSLPSETPVCIEKSFGKGRFCYFPRLEAERFWAREISPPKKWTFDPDAKGQLAFRRTMTHLLGRAVFWRTDAPDRMMTSIWRQRDGTIAVHFLNEMGSNIKAGEEMTTESPNPAFPEIGKDIMFSIPASGIRRVTAASPEFMGERELPFRAISGGMVEVTVPKGLFRAYLIVKLFTVTN